MMTAGGGGDGGGVGGGDRVHVHHQGRVLEAGATYARGSSTRDKGTGDRTKSP